jgi:hypothetical protein
MADDTLSGGSDTGLVRIDRPSVGVDTGALIPKDMTVRLVRADSANWETFLSCLYSMLLTVFGLFLGAWVSDSQSTTPKFTLLEKIATVSFGLIALVLIAAWIFLKVRQHRRGIKIPYELLQRLPSE